VRLYFSPRFKFLQQRANTGLKPAIIHTYAALKGRSSTKQFEEEVSHFLRLLGR
jgi:hypothetical protein